MTTRLALVDVIVVGFVDVEGTLEYQVVEERCDCIGPLGATKEDGEFVTFESEAHHLPQWCDENGFEYYEGRIETECVLEVQ